MARRLIREKKRITWRQYVSRLSSQIPMSKVWQMIKKIQGKGNSLQVQHLKDADDELLTSREDIANRSVC